MGREVVLTDDDIRQLLLPCRFLAKVIAGHDDDALIAALHPPHWRLKQVPQGWVHVDRPAKRGTMQPALERCCSETRMMHLTVK